MKFVAVSDTHDNVFAIRDLLDEVKKERFEFSEREARKGSSPLAGRHRLHSGSILR